MIEKEFKEFESEKRKAIVPLISTPSNENRHDKSRSVKAESVNTNTKGKGK